MDSLFVFLFSSDVSFFPALHRVFSISDLALIESVSSPTFCLYPAHNISPPKPFSLHPSLPLPLNSQERPWPHSFIPLQDGDSAFSNYSTCSALSNIPSLCFHPFSHLPPTPRPIFFFFPSLSSLFCLDPTYHPGEVIDNQVGLFQGEIVIGEGDEKEKAFWTALQKRSLKFIASFFGRFLHVSHACSGYFELCFCSPFLLWRPKRLWGIWRTKLSSEMSEEKLWKNEEQEVVN